MLFDLDRMVQRSVTAAEARRGLDRPPNVTPGPRYGIEQAHLLGEPGGDRGGKRAARAMGAAALDATVLEAVEPAVVIKQVDDRLALEMAALHQDGVGAKLRQPLGSAAHVELDPHRKAGQHLGLR